MQLLAALFFISTLAYLSYLYGYGAGNTDGQQGKNRHPPEETRYL